MKISVIHPSKGRPEIAWRTIEKWLNYADIEIEYILSLDSDDAHWYVGFLKPEWLGFENPKVIVKTYNNRSAVDAINNAAKDATGDLLVVVSDDFICPKYWSSKLLKALEGKSDFIVKTRDGLQPTLITLPILDREYYNRFGYIYFHGYVHMWSDTEMTAVGHMLGKVINVDMTFEHLHYSTGKSPKDEINVRNDLTWRQGEILFNERLKTNFGIKNPVMAYTDIQWR